jgi:hypothetical protein
MLGMGESESSGGVGVCPGNGTGLTGYRKTIMKFLFVLQETSVQPSVTEITSQVEGLSRGI